MLIGANYFLRTASAFKDVNNLLTMAAMVMWHKVATLKLVGNLMANTCTFEEKPAPGPENKPKVEIFLKPRGD